MSIRILLADDHAIFRQSLCKSLTDEADMEIVGQAEDGFITVQMVKQLTPDVVVMDIAMPGLNGVEATREISRNSPQVKVLALSMHSATKFVAEMFKAGAAGYLLKDCEFNELLEALRSIAQGKTYLSPAITDIVVDNYVRKNSHESSVFSALTRREREVLQLLSEGNTTKQIGRKLHISPKTVEAHRLRVMGKLDMNNVAQLTKYAIQEGLTSPEP